MSHINIVYLFYLLLQTDTCGTDMTSAVLAAAHSVPAPEESPSPRLIHFTDDIIEHSHVFRAFLEFAQTLHIPIGAGADTLANLLLFLRKWECQSLSNLLLERLRFTLPGHSLSSLHVFSIGAKIDDERLCDTALRSVDIMRSNPWLKTDSIDCVTRFDPSNWTLDFWEDSKIPPIYLFSIIQAWHRMQEKDCKGYRSPDDLADEFMKVLAETKERSA